MFSLIAATLQKTGVLGVFLLMLVENLLPFIPSELIMPMAGYEAARGALDPITTILAGAAGSVIGGVFWHRMGWSLGLERVTRWADRHGRWLTFSSKEVAHGVAWFERWGSAAVCIGRMTPAVRGVICLPAGIARMPFGRFLVWSSIGATVWSAVLVLAGYALKQRYSAVGVFVNPVADAFLALGLVAYLIRVFRHRRLP